MGVGVFLRMKVNAKVLHRQIGEKTIWPFGSEKRAWATGWFDVGPIIFNGRHSFFGIGAQRAARSPPARLLNAYWFAARSSVGRIRCPATRIPPLFDRRSH